MISLTLPHWEKDRKIVIGPALGDTFVWAPETPGFAPLRVRKGQAVVLHGVVVEGVGARWLVREDKEA